MNTIRSIVNSAMEDARTKEAEAKGEAPKVAEEHKKEASASDSVRDVLSLADELKKVAEALDSAEDEPEAVGDVPADTSGEEPDVQAVPGGDRTEVSTGDEQVSDVVVDQDSKAPLDEADGEKMAGDEMKDAGDDPDVQAEAGGDEVDVSTGDEPAGDKVVQQNKKPLEGEEKMAAIKEAGDIAGVVNQAGLYNRFMAQHLTAALT